MKELNGNLETSSPNNQANSQPDNSGVASANKNGAAPSKEDNEPRKPRSLAEIFADPSDESSTEINLDDNTPDDPNAPVDSIDRLIKRYKLTPEQVYAIKVPMPNGAEALTIGTLKDRIGEVTDLEIREVQFDERRIKQEGELLRSQSELKGILELLPKDALSNAVLKKVRERQDLTVRREKQLTLQHIPEWRNEEKRTAEIEGIVEVLGDYGFDESFLTSVVDHRAMKLLRDYFLIRSRIKKSLADVRDPKKLGIKPSGKAKAAIKPNASAPRHKAAVTQDDKIRNWFQSKE